MIIFTLDILGRFLFLIKPSISKFMMSSRVLQYMVLQYIHF